MPRITSTEFRAFARAVRIAEQCVRGRRVPLTAETPYILEAVQHLAAIEQREAGAKAKTETECLELARKLQVDGEL